MSVVWFWLIQDARARWRTWVLWTALVGFGGGIALTAFAGARRTDAAVPQMLTYSRPDDGSVAFGQFCPPQHVTGPNATSLAPLPVEARVLRLPQVASFQREMFLFASVRPIFDASSNLNVIATADAQGYRTLDRPLIVAGRVPDPTSGSDVWVNVLAANMLHVHVGSEVRLYTYSAAQLQGCGNLVGAQSHGPAPNGPVLTVRIAGIGRLPTDVNAVLPLAQAAGVNYEGQSNMFLGPGFVARYAASLGIPVHDVLGTNIYYVRLRHGQSDWSAFSTAASKSDPNALVQSEADGGSSGEQAAAASAQRGVHVEVVALVLFGAFAVLVTLVLAGQLIARQILIERDEYALLRSLGARHAQIRVVVLSRAALVGAAASIVAVAVAIVASPLMPFGLARQAELHPGVDVDAPVLAAGLAVIGILVVALAVVPAIVVSRGPLDQTRPSDAPSRQPRLGRLLALTALPITTVMGVRFGLRRGRGRTAVPVGSALVGAIAAVATLVGALTFAASLDHLIRTPRQQGWNWDVLVGNPNTTSDPWSATVPKLAHNQLVGSYSGMVDLNGGFTLDGHVVANVLAI
ncbi:MAG TPA: FtsX-like permease family protein, partial [Acidimicrobiia bacterium]|nr:FtsX-like permease family protein [Acidimicrobiia bacterium]